MLIMELFDRPNRETASDAEILAAAREVVAAPRVAIGTLLATLATDSAIDDNDDFAYTLDANGEDFSGYSADNALAWLANWQRLGPLPADRAERAEHAIQSLCAAYTATPLGQAALRTELIRQGYTLNAVGGPL